MKYLKLMRIKHYVKNLLIFIPLIFSRNVLDKNLFFTTLLGFVLFCLTASIIYIINDIKDVEKDKLHPIKKYRPIASGKVSIKKAYFLSFILLCIIVLIYFLFPISKISSIVLGIYLLINIGYSFGLKKIPIVDVILLVLGFILRIVYGAVIGNIEVSNWLYLTILVFAFFMGFGKRRNEIKKNNSKGRDVLKYYNYDFLDKIVYMFLTLLIAFYSLWAMSIPSDYMIYTTFLVIIIALKYTLNLEGDSFGDPVDMLFGDKVLLGVCVVYVIIVFLLLY